MNPKERNELIDALLAGYISEPDLLRLEAELSVNPPARKAYFDRVSLSQALAEEAMSFRTKQASAVTTRRSLWMRWYPLAAAAAVVLLGVASWWLYSPSIRRGGIVAHFGALQECRWVDVKTSNAQGDAVHRGQRVELSSGRAELVFGSGAVVTLLGPCIFEVESANGGFLLLGQMRTVAATPESKGFTVRTRTARVVDLGTEFVTSASADGQSRVEVASGEVDVHLAGVREPQRLRKGDALSVEAGSAQVIARLESGDETPAFRFPTLEPPSDCDFADHSQGRASIRVVKGALAMTRVDGSAPPQALLDGHAQTRADSPEESVYFANNVDGMLLLDLSRVIFISRINSYSWHQNGAFADQRVRAVQKFTLYGFAGDQPPSTDGRLTESGWTLIARVNSDEFFRVAAPGDRPAQQACSITGAHGPVGRYRFLLWELQGTQGPNTKDTNPTFYGEIDVHEKR
jgi:ferric-dicitrate binding protein FerR (iron transport regulator)